MSLTINLGHGLHFTFRAGPRESFESPPNLVGELTLAQSNAFDLSIFRVSGSDFRAISEDALRILRGMILAIGPTHGGLTACEALILSKKDGSSFVRKGSKFMQWDDTWQYRFDPEEMIATDWENVETYIPRLTNGRWGAAPDQGQPRGEPVADVMEHFPAPPPDRPEDAPDVQREPEIDDETGTIGIGCLELDCDGAREHFGKTTEQLDAFWHEVSALYRKHFTDDLVRQGKL